MLERELVEGVQELASAQMPETTANGYVHAAADLSYTALGNLASGASGVVVGME